ncbi:LysR family transcriptional regulator [Lactobacillus selangorensis]|uniref:LysR family transcriptional regulator n=1 Tax=Lactobacillus selangorensis TaxID=81857 RepID=A0A0R2FXL0_9LACO|nr:LysR family transcriptional regulator [Lactobacillus selangorensis]KRN28718.1 LysR family transcriptional regulator [Lactobacillus selangorensis]KRN32872.1 LysR family transcriptional regulator [Lactobacillus selangorensis]
MIENYLWTELAAFAQYHTLAKTADALHVTQPTVTRGLKKLEAELNVPLFDRQPNRIILTETGELAVKEAQKLLAAQTEAVTKIQNYARSQQILKVGATIPGPLILFHYFQAQLPANVQINRDLLEADIVPLLDQNQYTVILSDQEIFTDTVESRFLGTEDLTVNLNQFMYLANQPSVQFAELKGLSFLVLADIGPWNDIIKTNIPGAKFLYQQQADTFSELTKYSDFPFFSTNLSRFDPDFSKRLNEDDNRVAIPIADASAKMPVYANYLKRQKNSVAPLLKLAVHQWPAAK